MNNTNAIKAALMSGELEQAFAIVTISSHYSNYAGHIFTSFEEAVTKKQQMENEVGFWTEEEYYEGQGYSCCFEEIGWCKVGYEIQPLRFNVGKWEVFTCNAWKETYFPT